MQLRSTDWFGNDQAKYCYSVKFIIALLYVTLYSTVDVCYNVMKGTEYFVSLQTSIVIAEEYNVMVNSEELIYTTEYLTV
jgi:hypothetical protein